MVGWDSDGWCEGLRRAVAETVCSDVLIVKRKYRKVCSGDCGCRGGSCLSQEACRCRYALGRSPAQPGEWGLTGVDCEEGAQHVSRVVVAVSRLGEMV